MAEVWKDVKGYEGQYIVSNLGNVRSLDRYVNTYHGPRITLGQLLKQQKGRDGYNRVALCAHGFHKFCLVHRLVAEAFIPSPKTKPYINHKNGIKTDNRVENLEWVSASENSIHSVRVLGNKPYIIPPMIGKNNPKTKVVFQILDSKIIAEFYGTHEARRITGINDRSISACCRGKRNTAGGYQWKYQ